MPESRRRSNQSLLVMDTLGSKRRKGGNKLHRATNICEGNGLSHFKENYMWKSIIRI